MFNKIVRTIQKNNKTSRANSEKKMQEVVPKVLKFIDDEKLSLYELNVLIITINSVFKDRLVKNEDN